eukprot:SM000061S19295  [mRNA]  locus=s61:632077:636247:+ [translate_table: standard]
MERFVEQAEALEARQAAGSGDDDDEDDEEGDLDDDEDAHGLDDDGEDDDDDGDGDGGGDVGEESKFWELESQLEEMLFTEQPTLWGFQLEEALAGGSGRPAEDPRRIRYHDFFGDAPGPHQRRRGEKPGGGRRANRLEASDVSQEHDADGDVVADGEVMETEEPAVAASDAPTSMVSKHEAREATARRRIKELEEANLSAQSWTMLGEVAAGQRAKNSALEVDLDFEHAARPPPVLTEESTLSLEDVIRTRIAQGQFDDVVRKEVAVAAPLKEAMEIDESKSKKGLSEIYEASCLWLFVSTLLLAAASSVALASRIANAEYMHKTGQVPPPTSSTEAVKREATTIFRELCGKLEALAHFHFAPKPVVTDMTVRMDVPALAIEEVAPVAVTEASLLAPEEVFAGGGGAQGGVHGSAAGTAGLEEELAPADRRRRHRKHKRQRKGALLNETPKKVAVKPPSSVEVVSRNGSGNHSTSYTKATKVFSELEERRSNRQHVRGDKDDLDTLTCRHVAMGGGDQSSG